MCAELRGLYGYTITHVYILKDVDRYIVYIYTLYMYLLCINYGTMSATKQTPLKDKLMVISPSSVSYCLLLNYMYMYMYMQFELYLISTYI